MAYLFTPIDGHSGTARKAAEWTEPRLSYSKLHPLDRGYGPPPKLGAAEGEEKAQTVKAI